MLAALAFLGLAGLYFWRLGAWLINDDEGSYLYAAWRIALGERPYRDFLTPQLPAFLLPGGLALRVLGVEALVGRSLAVVLTLLAGVLLWGTVRRLFGPSVALLAGLVLLLHPEVYLHCRTFRPEPFMLFHGCLALYCLSKATLPATGAPVLAESPQAEAPHRRWLVLAGIAFGLGILSKLFAALPLTGSLAWLIYDGWQGRRPAQRVVADALVVAGVAGFIAAIGLGFFAATGAPVWLAVLGHHLMQGSGLGWREVLGKGLAFYAEFLRYNNNALLTFLALSVALVGLRRRQRAVSLFAWQLPTVLVFLGLSRELWPRHLIYLVPFLATLFAFAVGWLSLGCRDAVTERGSSAPGWLAAALAAAFLAPAMLVNRDTGWRWEDGTWRVADFVQLLTSPADTVFTDYSELNFYAQRPTTYSAASLSAGAAKSGQITWRKLQAELASSGGEPPLVLVDRTQTGDQEYGQLRFLHDLSEFEAWLATRYSLVGRIQRDLQSFEVYVPRGRPLPVQARLASGPTLLAAAQWPEEAHVGDVVTVKTAWRAEGSYPGQLMLTVRLLDGQGRQWAQADEALTASRRRLTERWSADEITAQRIRLVVPPGTPPGSYELRLAAYYAGAVEPVPLTNGDGSPLGRTVAIGNLQVVPWQPSSHQARRAVAEALSANYVGARPAMGALAAGGQRVGDSLELLALGPLPGEALAAGSTWRSQLWWRTLLPLARRSVHLRLVEPGSGRTLSEVSRPIGPEGEGASAWPPGTVVRQWVVLPVPLSAAPGSYQLILELAEATGRPLPGARLDAGQVVVGRRAPPDRLTSPPPVERRLGARFGTLAELYGVRFAWLEPPARDHPASGPSPSPVRLVQLVWRPGGPSEIDYQVSVQLVASSGRLVSQHDSVPAGGERPTTGWLPGEYVLDNHPLPIATDLPRECYEVWVAIYDPLTLRRLPVAGRGADMGQRAVRVDVLCIGQATSAATPQAAGGAP